MELPTAFREACLATRAWEAIGYFVLSAALMSRTMRKFSSRLRRRGGRFCWVCVCVCVYVLFVCFRNVFLMLKRMFYVAHEFHLNVFFLTCWSVCFLLPAPYLVILIFLSWMPKHHQFHILWIKSMPGVWVRVCVYVLFVYFRDVFLMLSKCFMLLTSPCPDV